MFQLSYRTSVFYNLVLSVSRTVIMLNPFYQIKIKTVAVVCALDLVFWIVIAGSDAYFLTFLYSAGLLRNIATHILITPNLMFGIGLSSYSGAMFFGTLGLNILTFLVPTTIIIITSLIQVTVLCRSRRVASSVTNQRQVTITVMMMSTLFVVCNSSTYLLMIFLWMTGGLDVSGPTLATLNGLLCTMFPILNAALNPVIIISRSNGLRESFMEKIPIIFKRRMSQRRNDVEMTAMN